MFSQKLKRIMLEYHLSSVEISRKARIHQSNVGRWISGESNPDYKTLQRIICALHIPPEKLF